jgi:hypothetical protein
VQMSAMLQETARKGFGAAKQALLSAAMGR